MYTFRDRFTLSVFLVLLAGCGGSSTTTEATNKDGAVPTPVPQKKGQQDSAKVTKDKENGTPTTSQDPVKAFEDAGGQVFMKRGKVDDVRLSSVTGNSETMSMLSQFPTATTVYLTGVKAKPTDFEVLTKLPNLSFLSCARSQVDD